VSISGDSRNKSINENNINLSFEEMLPNKPRAAE
jgi:hypothetical protein